MKKPVAYLLIGVPGSGKSTWIRSRQWPAGTLIASTDEIIEQYATNIGGTYDSVFQAAIGPATEKMMAQVRAAVNDQRTIVWDQTNTTVKSRRSKLQMLKGYDVIAVVFSVPPEDELQRRLANRPGKNIPPHIMKNMINSMSVPTLDEGFKSIITA